MSDQHTDHAAQHERAAQLAWEIRCLEHAAADLKPRQELEVRTTCSEIQRGISDPQRGAAFMEFAATVLERSTWQRAHGPGLVDDAAAVELATLNAAVEAAEHRHDLALARRQAALRDGHDRADAKLRRQFAAIARQQLGKPQLN